MDNRSHLLNACFRITAGPFVMLLVCITAFPVSSQDFIGDWLDSSPDPFVHVSLNVEWEEDMVYVNFPSVETRSGPISSGDITVFQGGTTLYVDKTRRVTSRFVRDGERVDFTERQTTRLLGEDLEEEVPVWDRRSMWTGERYGRFSVRLDGGGGGPGRVVLRSDQAKFEEDALISLPGGELLSNAFPADGKRLYDIFREHPESRVHLRTEDVGGYECEVIQCVSEFGIHTLWVDPEHGSVIRKAIILKSPDDLSVRGRRLGDTNVFGSTGPQIISKEVVFDNVIVSEIGGHFVPIEASVSHETVYEGETRHIRTRKIRLSNIDFSPDFDALNAFVIESLPERSIVYELRNGEIRLKVAE